MTFGLTRSALLEHLADAMYVPDERRSAFLGRFQHLQRLRLIEGINPGRGKAAEYRPNQVMVILLAFQMLQLGLSPERTVNVIKMNQDRIRLSFCLAAQNPTQITPSVIYFDPAIITSTMDGDDYADATFHFAGPGTSREAFESFFISGWVQRMAFLSVSGMLQHLLGAIDGTDPRFERPPMGERSRQFMLALHEWTQTSEPESLD